jgi:hypothetical protein
MKTLLFFVRFANRRAPAPGGGADCQPVIVPQCGKEITAIVANLARIVGPLSGHPDEINTSSKNILLTINNP